MPLFCPWIVRLRGCQFNVSQLARRKCLPLVETEICDAFARVDAGDGATEELRECEDGLFGVG
jgi:hypothetical protein